MIIGSGIGDITNLSIAAFASRPWIGIALGALYIGVVSAAIVRLFMLQPNRNSLTQIMRSVTNPRVVSTYTVLTAVTFTCGGLHVAMSAAPVGVDHARFRDAAVAGFVAIVCLAMYWRREFVQQFSELSGLLEIARYAIIICGSLLQLWGDTATHGASESLPRWEAQPAGVAGSTAALKAVLGAIFAFAGFESAAQSVGSPREVALVLGVTIALASGTYILTAQAAVPLVLGNPQGIPGPDIVPRLASAAAKVLLGSERCEGIVYLVTLAVQLVTILNGTVGCVTYSTGLLEDAAAAKHLGPASARFGRGPARSPAALLVLATAWGFWVTGQYLGLLETFATMNCVSHGLIAFVLLRLALARRSWPDIVLAILCLALVATILGSVLALEEAFGRCTCGVLVGCAAITFL